MCMHQNNFEPFFFLISQWLHFFRCYLFCVLSTWQHALWLQRIFLRQAKLKMCMHCAKKSSRTVPISRFSSWWARTHLNNLISEWIFLFTPNHLIQTYGFWADRIGNGTFGTKKVRTTKTNTWAGMRSGACTKHTICLYAKLYWAYNNNFSLLPQPKYQSASVTLCVRLSVCVCVFFTKLDYFSFDFGGDQNNSTKRLMLEFWSFCYSADVLLLFSSHLSSYHPHGDMKNVRFSFVFPCFLYVSAAAHYSQHFFFRRQRI